MSTHHTGHPAPAFECDVLIVEDDEVQCEEMASFLTRSGLDVQMANDAAQALHVASSVRPKVALLDYNLPDATGLELAQKLRARFPRTAILMMSGRIDGLSEQTLAQLNITVFVNKPLPLGPLRQAILRLVKNGGERPRRTPGWLAAGVGGTR